MKWVNKKFTYIKPPQRFFNIADNKIKRVDMNLNIHRNFDRGVDATSVLTATTKLIESQNTPNRSAGLSKVLDFNGSKMLAAKDNPMTSKMGGGESQELNSLMAKLINSVANILNDSDQKSSKNSGTDPNNQLLSQHQSGAGDAGSRLNSKGETISSSKHNIKSSGMTKDENALDFEWDGKKLDQHVDLAKNTINGKGKFDMHKEGDGGKKADTDAMERLLKREGESEGLTDEQAAGVFKALKQGGLDGKGLDVSNVMDQVKRLKNDPDKLNNYLEKIGAQEMSMETRQRIAQVEQENADPAKKFSGIDGLNDPNKDYSNLDLSVFTEYEITGKNKKTGKEETIKVTKDDIAESKLEPGRLQGLDGKDLSHLKDVKINGKVDLGDKVIKVNTMNVKDLNDIADGKKDWTDFKKKGFFEKIGSGIGGFFKGIGKAVKSVAVGAFNTIKSLGKGAFESMKGIVSGLATGDFSKVKDGFGKGFDGIKESLGHFAKGVKDGLGGVISAYQANIRGFAGAVLGDKVGDALAKGYGKVTNFVAGMVTSVTDGAANVGAAAADIFSGRGDFGQNLLKGVKGAVDVGLGVSGIGSFGTALKAGFQLGKAGAKAGKAGAQAAHLGTGAKSSLQAAKNAGKQSLQKADDGINAAQAAKRLKNTESASGRLANKLEDFISSIKSKFSPNSTTPPKAGSVVGGQFVSKAPSPIVGIVNAESEAQV